MNESAAFKDRLRALVDARYDGSVPKFSAAVDVSAGAVYKWLRGDSVPDLEFLRRLNGLSGVSVEWLVLGRGPMLQGQGGGAAAPAPTNVISEFCLVPLYDVEASAGGGAHVEREAVMCQLAFRHDWIRSSGLSVKDLAAVTVKGDSMEPTLRDGDVVLIDCAQTGLVNDAVYVIAGWGGLKVKRIQRLLNGDLLIISDNTIYKGETLTPTQQSEHPLSIAGRVVWFGRLVD